MSITAKLSTHPRPGTVGSQGRTLWTAGTIVCLALAAVALVDQTAWHVTADAVAAHYHPQGQDPDPDELTTGLAVFWAVGALAWWAAGRLARRGVRRALLMTHVIGSWLVTLVFAFAACTGYEFGGYVLPTFWRAVVWVPVTLGLVALLRTARALFAPRG